MQAPVVYCIRRFRLIQRDRKSTRLNSSHEWISYAVFCLKKKKNQRNRHRTEVQLRRPSRRETRPLQQASSLDELLEDASAASTDADAIIMIRFHSTALDT